MKNLNLKRLLISLLLGIFTVFGIAGVGILTYNTIGNPVGTIADYGGGECYAYKSFAYRIIISVPETSTDHPYTGISDSIEWDIGSAVVWVIIFSVCYWLIICLIQRFRKKKLKEII